MAGRCGWTDGWAGAWPAAAASGSNAAAAAARIKVLIIATLPPSLALHDRCLSLWLQRFFAALQERVDRMARGRRPNAQGEEKFCLRERGLGIAVAIQSQARQRQVGLGRSRRERCGLRQDLIGITELPAFEEHAAERQLGAGRIGIGF